MSHCPHTARIAGRNGEIHNREISQEDEVYLTGYKLGDWRADLVLSSRRVVEGDARGTNDMRWRVPANAHKLGYEPH
jgi:hypothetical protein